MKLLLVYDLISVQRARLALGLVDDWCWPMLDECCYDRKRRGKGYRLLHEIHHAQLQWRGGAVREQSGRGIVYNHIYYDSAWPVDNKLLAPILNEPSMSANGARIIHFGCDTDLSLQLRLFCRSCAVLSPPTLLARLRARLSLFCQSFFPPTHCPHCHSDEHA